MICTLHPSIFFALVAVQAIGLLSLFVARAAENSPLHAATQIFFLASLGGVGLSAMVALSFRSHSWIVAGITLAVMIVGATCDFSQSRRPAVS